MPGDPLDNPEIKRLLAEADNARALADQLGAGSDAAAALAGIYHDLGRALHLAIGSGTPAPSRTNRPVTSSLPPGRWTWNEDIDEDEPTVIDRPDEDEDAGIVSRKGRR